MFRRSIFLGLTVLLGAVFISLILKGRKEERLATRVVEIVKESVTTATRVISPDDLRIVDSKMKIIDSEDKAKGARFTASHSIVVENTGSVAYAGLRVEFSYLSRGGRLLESRSYSSPAVIPGGKSATLDDIILEGVPPGTTRSTARILSADLLPPAASNGSAKGR